MGSLVNLLRRVHKYLLTTFVKKAPPVPQGFPHIGVSPVVGQTLYLLAKIQQPKRILEIGTLGGYSARWLAKALPDDGELITIDLLFEAQFEDPRIRLIKGDAHEILPTLEGPFDLIFLDAEKEGYPQYLEPILELSRPGTLILTDNTIRWGKILEPTDPICQAVADFNQMVADHPKLESIILPSFGGRSYGSLDGITLSIAL